MDGAGAVLSKRVPSVSVFRFQRQRFPGLEAVLKRLPAVSGEPVRIHRVAGLRDRHGEVHAGTFLRERKIAFNCDASEFPRIFVHELFHFVWLRAGNPVRLSYEDLIRQEPRRGELGWSADWRKSALSSADSYLRTRRWREYCCESFCDTAAWLYSGIRRHPEFTLPARFRQSRRLWFRKTIESRRLSI